MAQQIELLAPAKNLECGIAAIDHGADAVYIGAKNFGARHAAGNSLEDITELCHYAHQFGAKVYATVNTIIYDNELDDAVKLVEELRNIGVDAILVQDMGLLQVIGNKKQVIRDNQLHASTQTDNRTIEKVKWLRSLGFSRVVLARELTKEEIKAIHEAVPDVELEVFVHGALCVSYSGQCYASQHCFGRSANRGECAQFCRLKFALRDSTGKEIMPPQYFLSLKDQCQINNLEAILDAGACSLKIEGRLKDVAYVKNVVAAYSQRLNDIIRKSNGRYCRSSLGQCEYTFTPDLKKSFNRGYTDYFLNGRNKNIGSFLTPKAIGEYVGKIKNVDSKAKPSITVAGTASFANGDGLCYIDKDGNIQGFRVNRAEGNRLFPLQMPQDLQPGTPLYRSQDQNFDRLMSGKTSTRTIPVTLSLKDEGTRIRLSIYNEDNTVYGEASLELPERQQAAKPQLENMRRQISKLGGTIYKASSIDIDESLDSVFIPSSQLADLRRRAVEQINIKHRDTETQRIDIHEDKAKKSPCLCVSVFKNPQVLYQGDDTFLNISNEKAREFYGTETCSAYELQKPHSGALLMQCRHCIRYTLGYCTKTGKRPEWKEPLYLHLPDGTKYRLQFDCYKCQMNVISE